MNLTGIFTPQGLALANSLLVSGNALQITRVVAGSGTTVENAITLANICQSLTLGTPVQQEDALALPATLSATAAEHPYELRELGLYATGVNGEELLYQIFSLDEPVSVTPSAPMELRFYFQQSLLGAEHIIPTISMTGYVTEATFAPIRETLALTAIPNATRTVNASELPALLAALPRLLTENLTITVSGTLHEKLTIGNFYGPGSLTINGTSAASCVFTKQINVTNCSCKNITIQNVTVQMSESDNAVRVAASRMVRVWNSVITGNTSEQGVNVEGPSHVYIYGCTITNCRYAVAASYMNLVEIAAGTYSGNAGGVYCGYCSVVAITDGAPNTLGGGANSKKGGIIIDNSGNLI